MGVWSWPNVTLKGGAQTIPKICPNCMKPANGGWYRYGYQGPLYFIKRTTYYQTFHYCQTCFAMLGSYFKWRKWGFVRFLFLYIPTIIGALILLSTSLGKKGMNLQPEGLAVGLSFAGTVLAVFLVYWGVNALWGLSFKKRFTLEDGRKLRAPAAYYTGSPMLDILGKGQIYAALRREWLVELVKANPDGVDDATYQQFCGEPRPAPSGAKPFA